MFLLFFFLLLFNRLSIALEAHIQIREENGVRDCTVIPIGGKQDDVPNIVRAFAECSNGGRIVFPENQQYWIASAFKVSARDVTVEWRGVWLFSDDLEYWRKNSYRVAFQNHRAGFILSGTGIRINGRKQGGIHGNGDFWYDNEKASTREGRPMPFVLWDVKDVTVQGFSIWQPQLWALNIMNGENIILEDIYVNATATRAPPGKNWVQNTDGIDTMDARNVSLNRFTYQGGDDCIAIKPRSYHIKISNVLCRGGNGVAIGSLGQYQEDSSVEHVHIQDVKIIRYNEDMHNSAYIKTWIGVPVVQKHYESAGQPRGGGWGTVRDIVFKNFHVEGADSGPSITQDNGNDGKHEGSSKLQIENVLFENFDGWLNGKKAIGVHCSKVNPCKGIEFRNVKLKSGKGGEEIVAAKCRDVAPGGVKGIKGSGCGS